jgi:hypothetical protein
VKPETRYAKSGDVHIAYQVTGSGPIDIVLVPGFMSHLDADWDNPAAARLLQRLSSFCRLIRLDKRGTGLSDRVKIGTLEERMDDVRAVMDAAGSQKAALFGYSEGGRSSGPTGFCELSQAGRQSGGGRGNNAHEPRNRRAPDPDGGTRTDAGAAPYGRSPDRHRAGAISRQPYPGRANA